MKSVLTKILPAFLLILSPLLSESQKQERQVFAYNVVLGAVTSGVGAVINKPKKASWTKYFVKGVWQGSIGGFLNYSGKKTLHLIDKKNEPAYGWPAKILHHAGMSIIENGALNEPFLQNWNFDLGPVRVDFSTRNKPLKVRFLPSSIYAIGMGVKQGRFDWNKSLKTGTMVFYSKDLVEINSSFYEGGTYQRSFVYSDFFRGRTNHIIAHELVHIFQYTDFLVLNTFFKPLEKNVNSKFIEKLFSKYVYMDIPYFNPLYLLEGKPDFNNYYKNWFEFEAERFATNRYVPR